jgi:hypothetical protein
LPKPAPTPDAQNVLLNSETVLNLGSGDYRTEAIQFVFMGAATLSYRCQYDGWIAGWVHGLTTGLGIAINIDLPSSVMNVAGVYTGYVLGPQNVGFIPADSWPAQNRFKFKKDDLINVRNLVAQTNHVLMVIGRLEP